MSESAEIDFPEMIWKVFSPAERVDEAERQDVQDHRGGEKQNDCLKNVPKENWNFLESTYERRSGRLEDTT